MRPITVTSSLQDKLYAQSVVKSAISSLVLIKSLGLETGGTIAALNDLVIFDKQLHHYIEADKLNKQTIESKT